MPRPFVHSWVAGTPASRADMEKLGSRRELRENGSQNPPYRVADAIFCAMRAARLLAPCSFG
jgi:hypothetical protein